MNILLLLAMLLALAPYTASAAAAPVLPAELAATTNNLQRAVWACEAGAQARAKPGTRFFLGIVENNAVQAEKPPLLLLGSQLSGFGQISNNQGWFNISFQCTVRPDLRQAKEFKFTVASPVQPPNAAPQPHIATAPDADKMPWLLSGTTALQLAHGKGKDQDFRADCIRGSGTIQLRLTHSLPGLRPGNFLLTGITGGPNSALYVAETNARNMPGFTIAADDPLWTWMGTAKSLLVNLGGEFVYEVSQHDSAPAIAGFQQACR